MQAGFAFTTPGADTTTRTAECAGRRHRLPGGAEHTAECRELADAPVVLDLHALEGRRERGATVAAGMCECTHVA